MSSSVKRNRWIVIVATAVVLAVVNWAIWQKEHHLAEGEIVYLELAPVDPRSLMQGDYMALSFALANRIRVQAQLTATKRWLKILYKRQPMTAW
ncbi:GDYXXLXY domain-containing protein [Halomonas qinghailakensis]|uniref:GDYXXLXY domain-containing protein n=1 Tax=Halomonas qinghailakensis TaxID=2937790 RepID=A0AA46TRM9_9GAMM|nr:GDYXXLXY domain-containing protein [Halomonas sp. ZZQ-149]UYO75286.1 GDYXXLXY domain-containing protein [Halomonas sp. ZZQ-149]